MNKFENANDQNCPVWSVNSTMEVNYTVTLTNGVFDGKNPALETASAISESSSKRRLFVIDSNFNELWGEQIRFHCDARGIDATFKLVKACEEVKTFDSVADVLTSMISFGLDRRGEPVIAIGGGVLLDIVGLAASLYRRGVPHVRVPTTLMALIDAGIGIKTGVNFDNHKNRAGTYAAPACVLLDRALIRTQDERHTSNGIAEILKMALISDRKLFELLERNINSAVEERLQGVGDHDQIIKRAVSGMLNELQPNLWEKNLERAVDYGHTFSPTLEMAAMPDLLHGEAVAIDMAICIALAEGRNLLTAQEAEKCLFMIKALGLPVYHPNCTEALLNNALADTVKHRGGLQRIPLTDGIGRATFINDISNIEITTAVDRIAKIN